MFYYTRADITTIGNRFSDILTHRFTTHPSLEIWSNLRAFCRCFIVENQTINKHFTGTFVNIYYFMLSWSIYCHSYIMYIDSCYHSSLWFTMQWNVLISLSCIHISACKRLIYGLILKIKSLQKYYNKLYLTLFLVSNKSQNHVSD